jgi:hypothetical protein
MTSGDTALKAIRAAYCEARRVHPPITTVLGKFTNRAARAIYAVYGPAAPQPARRASDERAPIEPQVYPQDALIASPGDV